MKVVLATTTSYPSANFDKIRSNLAIEMIQNAQEKKYEIVIVDYNSSEIFLEKLKKMSANVIKLNENGFGKSKRLVISKALERGEIIVLTEPEKISLIDFIPQLISPIETGEAELVIPRRKSLSSYPSFQQNTEEKLNKKWFYITHTNFDISFGPRVLNSKSAFFFLNYTGIYGDRWESIFLPVIDAIKAGIKIKEVEINYIHPRIQTEYEEGNKTFDQKRLDQLNSLTKSISTYWNKTN